MSTPEWKPSNLQKHYDKRIKKDDYCWRELLKLSRSMTKEEYEQESYKSYNSGSIEYEAEYKLHLAALYRVDKRTVLTVSSQNRRAMITCYHKHYHGRHEPGSTKAKLENLLEFIDDLEASLDGEIEKILKIKPVQGNVSNNQVKKYLNPKLKSIRSKCVKEV